MSIQGTIFIARGLPGSGRTTAIERVRTGIPNMVFVDADPPGVGVEFTDPAAHRASILRASEDIRSLVEHEVENIAVETCAPRNKDLALLLGAARKAGYSVEQIDPAGQEPNDVIYCFEKSSHEPSPEFLNELVGNWEPLQLATEPKVAPPVLNRAAAFKLFTQAMAAPSRQEAEALLNEVYRRFPGEAAALQLESGPAWGRLPVVKEPAFPLASISPYWAEVKEAVTGVAAHTFRAFKLPEPKPQQPEISPA